MKIPKPYALHITRREHWADKKHYNAISMLEWKSYVRSDQQMKFINAFTCRIGGEDYTIDEEGLSAWKFHIHKGQAVWDVFFSHANGNIYVVEPDKETTLKMIAIAGRLGARVQGDNGEIYEEESFRDEAAEGKPWWKFW